jgi:hypothetical protein
MSANSKRELSAEAASREVLESLQIHKDLGAEIRGGKRIDKDLSR